MRADTMKLSHSISYEFWNIMADMDHLEVMDSGLAFSVLSTMIDELQHRLTRTQERLLASDVE